MGDVVQFPGQTCLDVEPDLVIDGAKGKLKEVVVIGFENDGAFYLAASSGDVMKANWLIDLAKNILLNASLSDDV